MARAPVAGRTTIAIAGASGYVGTSLVARLLREDCKLVLIGRNPAELSRRFPDAAAAAYDDLPSAIEGADWLINLAVRNNDRRGSLDDFRRINVDLVRSLHAMAAQAGVRRFLHLSTFRADEPRARDAYGRSKREAEQWLATQTEPPVTVLRIPAVCDGSSGGRLKALGRLPRALRADAVVAAVRPQVSMDRLVSRIIEVLGDRTPPALVELADPKEKDRLYLAVKRALDIVFATAILGLLWWLLALVWLAVLLDTPGPGIFAQTRVGRNRRRFTCYKFRTMPLGTRQVGTHETSRAMVTRVGGPLRRLKLDELPQVINLLRGEMTLVGPRPCLPSQTKLIAERERRGVYRATPGITGWAQIRNIDMSDPVRLAEADAAYLTRRSVLLDLRILLATLLGRGSGDRTAA